MGWGRGHNTTYWALRVARPGGPDSHKGLSHSGNTSSAGLGSVGASCTLCTFSPGFHPWRRNRTSGSKIGSRNKQVGDKPPKQQHSGVAGSRSTALGSPEPIRSLLLGPGVWPPDVAMETEERYTLNTGRR